MRKFWLKQLFNRLNSQGWKVKLNYQADENRKPYSFHSSSTELVDKAGIWIKTWNFFANGANKYKQSTVSELLQLFESPVSFGPKQAQHSNILTVLWIFRQSNSLFDEKVHVDFFLQNNPKTNLGVCIKIVYLCIKNIYYRSIYCYWIL